MIKERKSPRVYFGWWLNLIMSIASGLGGGFTQMGASALFKPIASELGLNRAVASVASSIARLEGGIQAPIAGVLSDRFGAKWLVVGGTLLLCAGMIWMYYIDSVWAYYIAWGLLISTGFNLGLSIAQDKVLTDWFIKKRGLAFGVRFTILGILSVVTLPIISWQITTFGWRETCLAWAFIMLATVPFSLIYIKRHRPEYYGLMPDGAAVGKDFETSVNSMVDRGVEYAAGIQEIEYTFKQAARTSSFWLLVASQCGMGIIYAIVYLHCIPLLTDLGIAPTAAAGLMSLMAFVNTPARFFGGILSDRFKKERLNLLMVGAFAVQGVGFAAFMLQQNMLAIYLFLILMGVGSGIYQPLSIAMRGRYFGRKAYGSIQGMTQLIAAPISILAPVYAGWVYDTTGTYHNAFIVLTVVAAVVTVLMFFMRPPRNANTTDSPR